MLYPTTIVSPLLRALVLLALATTSACVEPTGVAPETPPTPPRFALLGGPDFWTRCTGIVCELNSTNWDATSQRWDFGHNAFGYGPQVLHTFPESGRSYLVTYYATDYQGTTYSKEAPVHILDVSARGVRVRGNQVAEVTWAPVYGSMDVYRDGALVTQMAEGRNTGTWSDSLGKRGRNASHTYQVCEQGTRHCSNIATAWARDD